jgi:hypothetical protein
MHAHAPGQDRETRELLLLPSLRDADSFQLSFADSWCGTARSPPARQSSLLPQEDDGRRVRARNLAARSGGQSNSPTCASPRTHACSWVLPSRRFHSVTRLSSLDDRPGLTGQRLTSLSPPTALRLFAKPVRVVGLVILIAGHSGRGDPAREIRVTSPGSMPPCRGLNLVVVQSVSPPRFAGS